VFKQSGREFNMKRKLMKCAAIAAFAAGMALAQTADPAQPQPQAKAAVKPRAALRRRLLQALNLTDAQKQQAKTIFQQARQNAQPLRQELQQNRQSLAAAVKANDTIQIRQLATQQGNVMGQLAATRSEAMAKFYASLTPDQRAKADKVQQRIQQRLSQRKNG
jgi:Spy/CpxP family protein refolding chaperone